MPQNASQILADVKAAKDAAGLSRRHSEQAMDMITEAGDESDPAQAIRNVTGLVREAGWEAREARKAADRAAEARSRLGDAESLDSVNGEVDKALEEARLAEEAYHAADEARKEQIANYAVEEELKVKEFFEAHKDQIYKKLEECDEIAKKAPTNTDMIFIAESLPIINSIIHVGSDRKTLGDASRWVRKTWGEETDALIVLSALLFIYVANKGADEKKEDRVWTRIHERVQKLL